MADSCVPRVAEFRRRIDDVIYRYGLTTPRNGYPAWKRDDLDLWILRTHGYGWIGCDQNGAVTARPWDTPVLEQGDLPPRGIWVSRKGDKSYVYDLVLL